MLRKYLKSLFGGTPKKHSFYLGFQLMISGIFAGYTANHIPKKYLKIFELPLFQFFIFFLAIKETQSDRNIPIFFAIMDAILFTILFNLLIYKLKSLKEEENNQLL